MSSVKASNKQVLLISSSRIYGSGYLDHAEAQIRDFLGKAARVLFVPFALYDRDGYAKLARERFNSMGYELLSAHEVTDAPKAVEQAEAVFIGGGNTFRLLKALYDYELLVPIRGRVAAGMPYIGSSAGSNVAGPTIKTTKDMPIVQPPSFNALGLVPFQISPHYQDPDPDSTHMGETQEERIIQFLEENETTVVGMREGAILHISGGSVMLKGIRGARIFRKGLSPVETQPGDELNELVASQSQEKR